MYDACRVTKPVCNQQDGEQLTVKRVISYVFVSRTACTTMSTVRSACENVRFSFILHNGYVLFHIDKQNTKTVF